MAFVIAGNSSPNGDRIMNMTHEILATRDEARDYGHDPYNSSARYAPPVRMRTDDPLVGQIRAALDARKLGYDRRRTLDLMQARGFGIEVEELQVPR